jgi:hypothetical protein
MNKRILFLIDHLANPDKYTQEELYTNKQSACDAFSAAACAAGYAAYWASDYAADADYAACYWVNDYFKITGEDKQTYIDKLKGES